MMAGGVACEAKAAAKKAGRNEKIITQLDTQRQEGQKQELVSKRGLQVKLIEQ